MLKGNAYGHGLHAVLESAHDLLDVVYLIEARDALAVRHWERTNGRSAVSILVIGAVTPTDVVSLAQHDVEVVCGDQRWAPVVDALRREPELSVGVHIHLDSGLGREGFSVEELEDALDPLWAAGDQLRLQGALTHFADVEDVTEHTYAGEQLARFHQSAAVLSRILTERGQTTPLVRHAAASAAALVLPESRLDAIRVGMAMYGIWPSAETRLSTRLVAGQGLELEPVLRWRCRSQAVRILPEGSFVGYGRTYRCAGPTKVAVLPVGYYDGYPRLLSNQAHVLVEGARCPVLGRVMMNHVVVDVSGVPSERDQYTATLIGTDGQEAVRAEDLSAWSQTIPYEVLARLPSHHERVVVAEFGP